MNPMVQRPTQVAEEDEGELAALRLRLRESEAERQRLQAQLVDRNTELKSLHHQLDHLMHKVSHDLRAPVRHITSFTPLVREMLAEGEDPSDCLDTMDKSARHLSSMIDALLALARLARAEKNPSEVCLRSLVSEVQRDVLEQEQTGRQVEWRIAPDLPTVQGDVGLLREMWGHLLSNALKFSRKCAVTQIEIGWLPASAQQNDTAHPNPAGPDGPTFYVQDNGAGFNPEFADQLFGLFQRLHRASEYEGTGLGLALARQIVILHGGHISARGALNQGCRISFSLPAS
ncbi:sensor histidine kinase [Variovorax sp. HJSM1_2]|uniref:sensor histidine kinase n=1 Tax=Variovorax sp. HJSM1_2 TaxID=3366263 RepID=UPI003BC3401E